MKIRSMTPALAVFAFVLMVIPAMAGNVTERMKRDCRNDYHRYCKGLELGSEKLRACMSRSIRGVSTRCIAALVDGGQMTNAQANRVLSKRKK
jgi:hypothetical protein